MKRIFIVLCFCFLYGDEYVHCQKSLYGALGLGSGTGTSPLDKFSAGNLADSGSDLLRGIVKQVPDSIPTPQEIFSVGKNALAGYPVAIVFEGINKFCSAAISQKEVKPKYLPNLNKINFLIKTRHGDYLVPLLDPEILWTHPEFNPELKTAILVTGWFSNINSTMENDALETVWEAYKCRGNINFIVIDTADFVDTLYTWSSFNTEQLGKLIAYGIVGLVEIYPKENIHLIGHSLGAHIVGAIGRYFNLETSTLLPRITGLDPASPCFNEGEHLTGLSRGDATFVDIIHSNSGVLGKRDPIGDVDFYPNGLSPLQPGCLTITCAHGRAWEFYAESVYPGNENTFMATRCSSITDLNSDKCIRKRIPMGYGCPSDAKGNYFLKTKRSSPFGERGLKEYQITCSA